MTAILYKAEGNEKLTGQVNLTRIRIDGSVDEIPERCFSGCHYLATVEFQNKVLKIIGDRAFINCYCLNNCRIAAKEIGMAAFASCRGLVALSLSEGMEIIGAKAFTNCPFTNVRIPSTVMKIEKRAFSNCERLVSVEIMEGVQTIGDSTFDWCLEMRNIAIPSTITEVGSGAFRYCTKLQEQFPDENELIDALKTRFIGLPIHELCYYQSLHSSGTVVKKLQMAIRESKKNETYERQDCLGMTPLHILTLSKMQNLEVYQHLVPEFPKDLITIDNFGDLPIYYACLSNAPLGVIKYLLKQHTDLFSTFQLDWKKMIQNACSSYSPIETIQFLLQVRDIEIFPNEIVDWKQMLREMSETHSSLDIVKCLVQSSFGTLLKSIGMSQWERDLSDEINEIPKNMYWEDREEHVDLIQSKLQKYKLKEITSLLEMTLWKTKIDEHTLNFENQSNDMNDLSRFRTSCRINCGVEIVIPNVLPFLGEIE